MDPTELTPLSLSAIRNSYQPQQNQVTLQPVDHDPFVDPMSGATVEQMQPLGNAAIAAGQGVANQLMAPGRVAQGQQPAVSGQWSDEDEALAQLNAGGQYRWGPGMALNMVGGGSPFAEPGAIGAAGGRAAQTALKGTDEAAAAESGLRGAGGAGGLAEAPPASATEGVSTGLEDNLIKTAQLRAQQVAGGRQPLEGLPQEPIKAAGYYVPGPNGQLHDIAEQYMREAGLDYSPPKTYAKVDRERAENIAQEYDDMRHDPSDPDVQASYNAMANETLAQYQAIKRAGIKFDFIQPGMKDPYAATPRLAAKDLQDNNHLWVFPTESGFGTENAISDNPLLRDSGETINGRPTTVNDIFRIVHDIFGHFKDGNGFRAAGEENAWRSHSAMYSDAARPAMTNETRGQNSWVNFGPHGEANRTASAADTVYADQKIGRLPDWVVNDGRFDPGYEPPASPYVQRGVGDVAQRNDFSGIYDNPRIIAARASANVAPEDPALKQLFGVTRDDLYGMSQQGTRPGNVEPSYRMPVKPKGSYVSDALMNPTNAQRLVDTLGEAGKYPQLTHGMDAWYVMDPAYQRLEQLYGPEMAKKLYNRFNTVTSMHSPGSPVTWEFQRGTSANQLINEGRFRDWQMRGVDPSSMEGFEDVPGHPYSPTAHTKPLAKYLNTGQVDMTQPKVPLYMQASGVPQTGFQTRLPVPDAHFARGVGAADVRTNANPGVSMKGPEYNFLGPWYRENVAEPLGLQAVPAQARQWGTLAHITGVDTPIGAPKLEILAKLISERAQRLGIDPAALRDAVLSGKAHATWLTPGILTALAAARGQQADQ